MWTFWLTLACRTDSDRPAGRSADSLPADTAPGDTPSDDTGAGDSAPPDTGGDGTTDTRPCSERAPAEWTGCVVTGEFRDSYDGEVTTTTWILASTLLPCSEPGCAWSLVADAEFHPEGDMTYPFTLSGTYYPDGVTGSGIGELALTNCLLGAEPGVEAPELRLSPRPEGADADALAAGFPLNACASGGSYDLDGWLVLE